MPFRSGLLFFSQMHPSGLFFPNVAITSRRRCPTQRNLPVCRRPSFRVPSRHLFHYIAHLQLFRPASQVPPSTRLPVSFQYSNNSPDQLLPSLLSSIFKSKSSLCATRSSELPSILCHRLAPDLVLGDSAFRSSFQKSTCPACVSVQISRQIPLEYGRRTHRTSHRLRRSTNYSQTFRTQTLQYSNRFWCPFPHHVPARPSRPNRSLSSLPIPVGPFILFEAQANPLPDLFRSNGRLHPASLQFDSNRAGLPLLSSACPSSRS